MGAVVVGGVHRIERQPFIIHIYHPSATTLPYCVRTNHPEHYYIVLRNRRPQLWSVHICHPSANNVFGPCAPKLGPQLSSGWSERNYYVWATIILSLGLWQKPFSENQVITYYVLVVYSGAYTPIPPDIGCPMRYERISEIKSNTLYVNFGAYPRIPAEVG
jgi:hypothetical protein